MPKFEREIKGLIRSRIIEIFKIDDLKDNENPIIRGYKTYFELLQIKINKGLEGVCSSDDIAGLIVGTLSDCFTLFFETVIWTEEELRGAFGAVKSITSDLEKQNDHVGNTTEQVIYQLRMHRGTPLFEKAEIYCPEMTKTKRIVDLGYLKQTKDGKNDVYVDIHNRFIESLEDALEFRGKLKPIEYNDLVPILLGVYQKEYGNYEKKEFQNDESRVKEMLIIDKAFLIALNTFGVYDEMKNLLDKCKEQQFAKYLLGQIFQENS
ncbi:hypothetical protein GYA19_03865 [Candidatus Beckwithbacteria bacterium]|nr:hypothetical protein [Candidatus Beckwithbacteria bacterium]